MIDLVLDIEVPRGPSGTGQSESFQLAVVSFERDRLAFLVFAVLKSLFEYINPRCIGFYIHELRLEEDGQDLCDARQVSMK